MIPLTCPSCRSLRISGGGVRFHCKECGRYLSQKSLSRQLRKRAALGCNRRGNGHKEASTAQQPYQHNDLNFLFKKYGVFEPT